jgi:hypothetical protein
MPHFAAQGSIEIRQGLVKQENPWFANDCTTDGNPLALTARQGTGQPIEQMTDTQNLGRPPHRFPDDGL